MSRRIQRIEAFAQDLMHREWPNDFKIAHDYKHVDRVRRRALHIAGAEDYPDLEQVEAATLLHDIGLSEVNDRRLHAEAGARLAADFLRQEQLFPNEEITAIAEAIRAHSSLEGGGQLGAILRDGDILDLLGAVGLMRAYTSKYANPEYDLACVRGVTWGMGSGDFTHRFRTGQGVGSTIADQINFQISCVDNLTTETARRLARPLVDFMQSFVLQLESEIE